MEITVDKKSAKLLAEAFKDVAMDDLVSAVVAALNTNKPTVNQRLLSTPKLGHVKGMSRETITAYVNAGMPHISVGETRKQWRFDLDQVNAWLKDNQERY